MKGCVDLVLPIKDPSRISSASFLISRKMLSVGFIIIGLSTEIIDLYCSSACFNGGKAKGVLGIAVDMSYKLPI